MNYAPRSLFQTQQFLQRIMLSPFKNIHFYREFYHLGEAKPSRAGPSRAEPSRAEQSRAEPSRAEPGRAEPSRAEPSRAELSRGAAEPGRPEPNRAEPSRAGPSRRRLARHIVQKQQFLQRILHFYTLFKNSSFYNEFGYFAIEVSVLR